MFQCHGIWLPDGEQHLVQWLNDPKKCPEVDGKGSYQIHKLRRALEFTARHRRAVDIGAHVGFWSMQLVKQFQWVEAFEPMHRQRECWLKNMAGLGGDLRSRASLRHQALGDHGDDTVRLITPAKGSSGDSFVMLGAETGHAEQVDAAELVTLDSFDFQDVDFVKADCEGYELFALKGAKETLLRWRPTVIVEQKPRRAQKYGLGETDAVTWLQGLGATLRDSISGDYILSW